MYESGNKYVNETVTILSYGVKYGNNLPVHHHHFDCQKVHNPHKDSALQPLNGLHPEVQAFVMGSDSARLLVTQALLAVCRRRQQPVTVLFTCYGGRHRSVTCAEALAKIVGSIYGRPTIIRHLGLERLAKATAA